RAGVLSAAGGGTVGRMVQEPGVFATETRLAVISEAVRHIPTSAFVTDAGQETGKPRILFANDAVVRLTGYTLEQMEGRSPLMFARPDADPVRLAKVRDAFAEGRVHESRTVQVRPDGSLYAVDWTMSPVHDKHGHPEYFVWLQRDASREIGAQQMRDTLFEAVNLSDDSVIISDDTGIVFVNDGFRRLSGLRDADVLGQGPDVLDIEILDWRTVQPIAEPSNSARNLIRTRGRREGALYLDIATTVVFDPVMGTRHVVHVGKDVTQEIGQRLDEHQKAQRDPLTGLYNRRGGEEALVGVRAASVAAHTTFSVLMCDIDRFKLVNDTHGHAVGDQVIIEVARVLDSGVREGDSLVRWGGEEFLVVLPETSAAAAFDLAERLRTAISGRDIAVTGPVTVSIGVAEWSEGDGLAGLVSRADAALYVS